MSETIWEENIKIEISSVMLPGRRGHGCLSVFVFRPGSSGNLNRIRASKMVLLRLTHGGLYGSGSTFFMVTKLESSLWMLSWESTGDGISNFSIKIDF